MRSPETMGRVPKARAPQSTWLVAEEQSYVGLSRCVGEGTSRYGRSLIALPAAIAPRTASGASAGAEARPSARRTARVPGTVVVASDSGAGGSWGANAPLPAASAYWRAQARTRSA